MRNARFAVALAGGLVLVLATPMVVVGQGMRDSLQGRVMERFMQNYLQMARLSDEQARTLQEVVRESFQARAELRRTERDLWMALEGQLRPGVAADPDSLTALLDRLMNLQQRHVELARSEQARFAEFLTPVQRALLTMQFRRLQHQIERIRMERGPPMRRP